MKKIPISHDEFVIVDDGDFELVSQYSWNLLRSGSGRTSYATAGHGRRIMLHRLLLKAKRGEFVDHINGNGLDNRRENLRICTKRQNGGNRRKFSGHTSKYLGVYWHKQRSKWCVSMTVNGKSRHIGLFESEIDAAKAYDAAATDVHKEFARPNFPRSEV